MHRLGRTPLGYVWVLGCQGSNTRLFQQFDQDSSSSATGVVRGMRVHELGRGTVWMGVAGALAEVAVKEPCPRDFEKDGDTDIPEAGHGTGAGA